MTALSKEAEKQREMRRRRVTIRSWQRKWFWWMNYLCIGSGVGIFALKYLTEPDPFAIGSGNPMDPWFKGIHLLTSPILIYVIGSMMIIHVIPHFRERKHFWSGNFLLASFAVFSISGMFLFFLFPEEVIEWLKWIHTISGIIFLPIIFYHWWVRNNASATRRRGESG